MLYGCIFMAGAFHYYYISIFERFPNYLRWSVSYALFSTLQPISHRRSPLLFYHLFLCKYSDELHSVIPSVRKYTFKILYNIYAWSNNPHFSRIPSLRRKLHSENFLPRVATLGSRYPGGWFPEHFSLNPVNSHVNRHLQYIILIMCIYLNPLPLYDHAITPFSNPRIWIALGLCIEQIIKLLRIHLKSICSKMELI